MVGHKKDGAQHRTVRNTNGNTKEDAEDNNAGARRKII